MTTAPARGGPLARTSGRALLVVFVGAWVLAAPGRGPADDAKKSAPTLKGAAAEEVVRLKREVDALETLYHLEPSKAQLTALLALAEKTAAKPPAPSEAKASPAYVQALRDLRAALTQEDDDRVTSLYQKLTDLDDEAPTGIDEEFEITDAAMKSAPAALRMFTPAQVVAYLAALEHEVPDPVDRILATISEGEDLTGEEWTTLRDETAQEVAWLVHGFNAAASKATTKAVTELLDRGHRAKGDALKKELEAVEQAGRRLIAGLNPVVVLQHYMERELAELLSNPRAAAALKARLEKPKK